MLGHRGQSVLALVASQWRPEHAHVHHRNTRVILVKELPKNSENVSYDLVKVSSHDYLLHTWEWLLQ